MAKRVLIPFRHSRKVKPYVAAVEAAGLEAIAGDVQNPLSLEGAQGLLLMGGSDVNPARYHAVRDPETEEPDDARDEVELSLIGEAIEKDLPILAICRGLQILNVYHGGTLLQHIPNSAHHDVETEDKGAIAHAVAIEPGSLLARIAGVPAWQVNSRHHQAADRLGSRLEVSARDLTDGTIEALERRDARFVIAVQWHPEDQVAAPEQRELFRRFAEAL
jgi:putative glutamine amidotransferase